MPFGNRYIAMTRSQIFLVTLFLLAGSTAAHTSVAQDEVATDGLVVQLVEDLNASTSRVFFSFSEGGVVEVEDETSDNWDISFEGTDVKVNGQAQLLSKPFKSVAVAPEDGYRVDTAEENAIPKGSDMGWYSYDFNTHVITVIENTIVVETPAKKYAKMEIISFYKGGDDGLGAPMFFSFRYAFQPDGSRNLR